MSSLKQINANRLNSRKSTGPRSAEGKAASRFNALKTGIDAKANCITGEDPDELQALTGEYHQRWQPATPEQRCLVDILVSNDWQLRRLRRADTQLWNAEIEDLPNEESEENPLGHAFYNNKDSYSRLQRRIDSTDRAYHRALTALKRLQSEPSETVAPVPEPEQPQRPSPPPPADVNSPATHPVPTANLASFPHNSPPPHPVRTSAFSASSAPEPQGEGKPTI